MDLKLIRNLKCYLALTPNLQFLNLWSKQFPGVQLLAMPFHGQITHFEKEAHASIN